MFCVFIFGKRRTKTRIVFLGGIGGMLRVVLQVNYLNIEPEKMQRTRKEFKRRNTIGFKCRKELFVPSSSPVATGSVFVAFFLESWNTSMLTRTAWRYYENISACCLGTSWPGLLRNFGDCMPPLYILYIPHTYTHAHTYIIYIYIIPIYIYLFIQYIFVKGTQKV